MWNEIYVMYFLFISKSNIETSFPRKVYVRMSDMKLIFLVLLSDL